MLLFGYRVWPAIFVGAFALNLSTSIPVLAAVGIASGNTSEALIATYLITRFLTNYPFESVRSTFLFIFFIVIATTVSASAGVVSLLLSNIIDSQTILVLWPTWWLGDLVGGVVVAPLILTLARRTQYRFRLAKIIEAIGLISLSTISALFVFGHLFRSPELSSMTSFLLIPALVWAALRFYQHGATILVALFTCIAVYSTLRGYGPFIGGTANESLLMLQTFMAIIMTTALSLAASVDETAKANQQLSNSQVALEQKVLDRTNELSDSNKELVKEIVKRRESTDSIKRLFATTKLTSSENYFHAVTKELSNIYHSKFAFIGLLQSNVGQSISTLSVRIDNKIANNFDYSLRNTPCQDVLNSKIELIPCDVASLYPKDDMLREMGIDSYFGAPIISSDNKTIGIVVIMHDKPIEIAEWLKSVIGLIAKNVSFEIERESAKEALQLAASVYDKAVEAIIIYDKKRRIIQANKAFTKISGYLESDVIGKDTKLLKSGRHDTHFYETFWRSLNSEGTWQGEIWNKKKNGDVFPCWQTITVVKDGDGDIKQYISIFSDITESKKTEAELYRVAHYDLLTGLTNRNHFMELLENELDSADRKGDAPALLFLDLDHFKNINDSSGHSAGDLLLVQVAERLAEFSSSDIIISRLGGDEFTLFVKNRPTTTEIEELASKILFELKQPYCLDSLEVVVSVSIGFSFYPADAKNLQELLKYADIAMYNAKSEGRNQYKQFVPEMNFEALQRVQIEQEIRVAIERFQFEIHYQPQAELKTGKLVGCEALIRWNHPSKGFLAPDLFIPIAEESGLIVPLGNWVLETACRQFMLWVSKGYRLNHIAVNLSARQFKEGDIRKTVKDVLIKTGMKPKNLELELTESMLMENIEETIQTLNDLREIGVQLSIDDFGTGYSSLAYLKHFPINKLKIDRSFINDLFSTPADATIVKTTINLAHGLGLTTIAEGVETREQKEYLSANACEEMQGYYYCKPLPADSDQLIELLTSKTVLD